MFEEIVGASAALRRVLTQVEKVAPTDSTVPMLGLTILGRAASTTVIGGAQHLWDDGQETVSALVFFTAVLAPALQIIFMLAIVLGARRKPRHDGWGLCFATIERCKPGA